MLVALAWSVVAGKCLGADQTGDAAGFRVTTFEDPDGPGWKLDDPAWAAGKGSSDDISARASSTMRASFATAP